MLELHCEAWFDNIHGEGLLQTILKDHQIFFSSVEHESLTDFN